MESTLIPVILCGGKGTRLWPLSRQSFPKQFLTLYGNNQYSLLQKTQIRLSNIKDIDDPIIVCNEDHRFIVAEQMRSLNVKPKAIILEPMGKNTAPAITLAALKASENNPKSILLVLSADHKVDNDEEFTKIIGKGIAKAKSGSLVTFGVIPTYPETGYGYIESEDLIVEKKDEGSRIIRFIEKPDSELAKNLYQDRKYSWNSGIFAFETNQILKEIKKYAPLVLKYCSKSMSESNKDLDFTRIESKYFEKSPDISIDVGIMEKTDLGAVFPLDVGWSDIGNWKSLWENEIKDSSANVIKGRVLDKKSNGCYIRSENRLLVTIGLKDLIVVETSDAILVANKNNIEEIKYLVENLNKLDYKEGWIHKKIFRPWGSYTTLVDDINWQVKRIEVKPGSKLSLQMHHHRAEHWIVVSGTADVLIENKNFVLSENQSAYIPLGSKHRLSNPGKIPLTIIEVQSGKYLGEDDIIRFEDNYGRI